MGSLDSLDEGGFVDCSSFYVVAEWRCHEIEDFLGGFPCSTTTRALLDDGYELEIATYDGRPLAFDVGGRHRSVGRCDARHHDPIVNPNIS